MSKTISSPNPVSSGRFGCSVAIAGRTIVIGAKYEENDDAIRTGNAYVYTTSGRPSKTLQSSNPEVGGMFGCAVAYDGTSIVVGAYQEDSSAITNAGKAYVFG